VVALLFLGNLGILKMVGQGISHWLGSDWYWIPSRIIPVPPGEVSPITEFPCFSFLYGDLHAHIMALPLTLLALAWSVSIVKSKGRLSLWTILGGGLMIGILRITNTWDFPVYLLLGILALVYSVHSKWIKIGSALLLVIVSVLLFRPFDWWYALGYSEVELWKGSCTPITAYLAHWGLFLFVIGTWLVGAAKTSRTDSVRMVLTMIVTAVLLTLMVEIVVVRGDIGRMNSVFRFYYQAWTLLSISAAVALGWYKSQKRVWWIIFIFLIGIAGIYPWIGAWQKVHDRIAEKAPRTLDGMAFMKYATYFDEGAKLDLSQDYQAIRWMQEHIQGSPVIVEAHTPEYRWGSRFTVYTGLPGILGWSCPQRLQRKMIPGEWIDKRMNEIDTFYQTTDIQIARAFLQKYQVRYIILGQLERAYYPGKGMDKFKILKKAYRTNNTIIYEANGSF